MGGNSLPYRYWVRVMALVLVEVAVLVVLLRTAPLMGSVNVSHFGSWLSQTTPSAALTGLIRLAGMALSAWLAASTLLYGVAVRSSGATGRRRVARLTLSPLRRLIDSAAALSILVSATTTSASVAGVAPASAATVATSDQASFHPAPGPGTTGSRRALIPAGSGPAPPPVSASVIGRHLPHPGRADHNDVAAVRLGTGDLQDMSSLTRSLGLAVGTRVYVVRPGDCLSVIAERHLGTGGAIRRSTL